MDKERRSLLKAGAAAGVAAATGGGIALMGGTAASLTADIARATNRGPRQETEDLVFINGRIYTMDERNSVASAVTIRRGRFTHVGHGAHVGGPDARVIDLRGRTVVPGLIEGHVHIVSMGNRPGYHVPLENTTTIREVQEVLAKRRRDVPQGQWITSMGGWYPNQWVDFRRRPTRAELDAAVSDRPVIIWQQFTGPAVVNSLGKAFFDMIDAGPLPHPDAVKIRVADDGTIAASGFTGGGPSATALYVLRTMQTFEDKKRSTLDAMSYATSVGLTAMLDEVLFPTPGPLHPFQILSNLDQYRMYDAWLELHRERRTSLRLQMNFLQNQADPNLPELKERLRNQFQFFGDDMLMTGSIGEWAAPLSPQAVWLNAQRLVAQAGWRNENSVQTLNLLEQVVAGYETVEAEELAAGRPGIKNLRWMVHHVPFVTTGHLDRLHALGCGVEMAAFRWVTAAQNATAVGAQFRTIVDHAQKIGMPVGIHGDGVHIAPLNPWQHIYFATTGLGSFGTQINAGQQLTREEALRLFTRGNSYFLKMEDKIGSIETGKLADLVVLSDDYFRVRDEDLKKLRSVMTVVDGEIVHDTGVVH